MGPRPHSCARCRCPGYQLHPGRCGCSSREAVVVMESSEHRRSVDGGAGTELRRGGRGAERGWASLVDALVRPRGVEVAPVLVENALKMALAQQEDVIQAFSP